MTRLRVQGDSADGHFIPNQEYEVTNLVTVRSVPKLRSVQGTKWLRYEVSDIHDSLPVDHEKLGPVPGVFSLKKNSRYIVISDNISPVKMFDM